MKNRNLDTGLNQLKPQTPEPATLDKIEDHVNILLKSIEECYKQFLSQPWNTSLKSSIIELKIERDKLYHKANDHTSTLETKLRNEIGKNKNLTKKLEEFKAIFGGHTTARGIAEELRETKEEMEGVADELKNTIEENKQLSRIVERSQTELDRYRKAMTRLEKENEELSLRLNTLLTLKDSRPLPANHDSMPRTLRRNRQSKEELKQA